MLKLGKELGLVEVRIKEPMMAHADLEAQFLAGYPLRNITIIPALIDNPQIIARDVYTALIEDLPKYIDDDSVLGVAWGTTVFLRLNVSHVFSLDRVVFAQRQIALAFISTILRIDSSIVSPVLA